MSPIARGDGHAAKDSGKPAPPFGSINRASDGTMEPRSRGGELIGATVGSFRDKNDAPSVDALPPPRCHLT
eukprot:3440608-Pyramimonas_sp.AAC.1